MDEKRFKLVIFAIFAVTLLGYTSLRFRYSIATRQQMAECLDAASKRYQSRLTLPSSTEIMQKIDAQAKDVPTAWMQYKNEQEQCYKIYR